RRAPSQQLSPTQLCDALLANSATMTGRLDKLEGEGLVRRRHDETDRRGVVVQMTAKGRRVADRILAEVLERRNSQVAALTDSEKSTLSALLRKLLESLEQQANMGKTKRGRTSRVMNQLSSQELFP